MPRFDTKVPAYKRSREASEEWDNFRKGLNLLLRATELKTDELAKAENIMLTGGGVATGRWGTELYFTAGETGTTQGIGTFKNNDGTTDEIFVLTDQGYLQKKDGTGSSVISGQSWPSGTTMHTAQLGGKTYIASPEVTFTEYDGSSLVVFQTISAPTGVYATNFSGATGANEVSYKIVAIGQSGGQTTPSGNYVLGSLPTDLALTQIHVFWTAPSAATLGGFEVYRGDIGNETYLASVGPNVNKYIDSGGPASQIVEPPITNTTGGVKSKFITKVKDRLLVVDKDDPNKLLISGRYPNHTKFNWADGGGYVYIDPDSGDNITGINVQPIADRIVVYKEKSSYLVDLEVISIGNFAVLDPKYQPISTAIGCSSQDTIQTVENDTFYFGRDGVYVTGYEPNFLNIIRTNEVSAKIRPYLELLNDDDYASANALYVNNKYILFFPRRKEAMVYDRERGAWLGPWRFPYGISHAQRYIDSAGTERWVLGSYDSNKVYIFNTSSNTDAGTAISKTLRTSKTNFGDWTILYIVQFFYILFGDLIGETTVNILAQERDGTTTTIKSFTISGAETAGRTGWGMSGWGLSAWGDSSTTSALTSTGERDKWGTLFKQARLLQIEVISSAANSNFELLQAKVTAAPQSRGSLSSSSRV